MAKKRKIKCDCGAFLEERITLLDDIETEAMVCPHCRFVTLTKEQAQQFAKLKQVQQSANTERKIIKIGNSIGLILPEQLQGLGIKIGRKVKIEALTSHSFRVKLV